MLKRQSRNGVPLLRRLQASHQNRANGPEDVIIKVLIILRNTLQIQHYGCLRSMLFNLLKFALNLCSNKDVKE